MQNGYDRRNRSSATSQKNKQNVQAVKNTTPLRIVITAAVINIIVVAIMVVFSFIVISSPETREIFTKLVFLPITAFAGSFISLLFNKKLIMNVAGGAVVWFIAFLIFVDFSFWAFTWLLFYMANALLGFMSSYIARTFH